MHRSQSGERRQQMDKEDGKSRTANPNKLAKSLNCSDPAIPSPGENQRTLQAKLP